MALPRFIPVEEFFTPPAGGASISPDGATIAFLAPWRDRLNLWVRPVDVVDEVARRVSAEDALGVREYHWSDDSRWLLYTRGGVGTGHLYRVDLLNPVAPVVDLTPFPGTVVAQVDLPLGRPGRALLTLSTRRPDLLDLHELDIASGDLTLVARSPGDVGGWVGGRDGAVFACSLTEDGDIELSRWDGATRSLTPVALFDGADHPTAISPTQPTPDGTGLWIGSNRGSDRTRLARLDLATGTETEVDSHPAFDLDTRSAVASSVPSPLILRRGTGELLGARYLGERQVIHALDPHFAEVLANLQGLSDGDLAAVSSDVGERRWVVSFTHDRDPGATFLYDHVTGESRLLSRSYPRLEPEDLAPMTPVTITARDDVALPSYLTLPVGVEPVGLPLVLVVHGGPWLRDAWGYHPVVQQWANRGYAVLQVNYRGSTGYGKTFVKAAIGEFAGRMHDDLIDAAAWAVREGYADPRRIGIFGGGYGGYAALVGAAFTPNFFAAAVDYVGIADLTSFMRRLSEAVRPFLANNWHLFVGDPEEPAQEADMLSRSPISRLDQIRTPLFLVRTAGGARAESDDVVSTLRARGVDVEYQVTEYVERVSPDVHDLIDLQRAAERFLARHLGGRQAEES
ncbi:dipeptidyl aminopeptidase/acylaminoacyl peptidase [Actinoalloteichus hoggarensis]|uniref:Prolyl endopeptidase n=1 Tax=Actinoalloteichus hoggarensis TaxID=1470176 RepID=A0A221W3C6_9PSEU|nr:prolyl oligopeptidase family serine peptidase [Actinoalloteichus hoggarensis]ASO20244.1 Prolyl endopeptidase precursor [Actinoalloteichus hoggarensis]MBB5919042.1 dipeptidyl aminopeptidase/acylaminoacyl peptidase [Actinoalloteichus hoggarensis]